MASISVNIVAYFIKYILAYTLQFIIIPCFIFTNIKTDILKSAVSNYIKMTFFIVIFGYITILLRLYEFITFFIIVIIFISYKYYKQNVLSDNIKTDIKDDIQILVINHVDNVEKIQNKFFKYVRKRISDITSNISIYFGNVWSVLSFAMLLVVFGVASYLCFYDSFSSVAPPANESYLSLVGMKYLGNRILFSDNIYPQGFYIVLETMQKIFQVDHLYIINFTGALNSILLAFGMYYFVSKITENKVSGISAVIIYGIFGTFFINQFNLQIVASPQQFAILFILPVLYFFHEYISNSKKEDFFVFLCGASLIGLIHPVAFVFLAIGVLALCIANILRDIRGTFYKSLEAFTIMLIAAVISVLPIGIGLLLGKTFSMSMVGLILKAGMYIEMPTLRQFDYFALASLAIIFISLAFCIRNKRNFINKMWIFLFGITAFSLYQYCSALTNSQYINDGASTLWSLLIPIVISFAISVILDMFKFIFRAKHIGYYICGAAIITIFFLLPQNPIITEKQEYNSSVTQYLRISKLYRPTQWMIVSWKEGYSLSLGNGFHMMIDDFIDKYDPEEEKLVDKTNYYEELGTEDIFIFYEKNVFYNKYLDSDEYRSRSDISPRVSLWLNKYQESHSNLSLFYSDENIEVWQIHRELDKEEIRDRVWQQ